MNDEKANEQPNEKSRSRWRNVLLYFFFMSSFTITWQAVSKLHSAGQPVRFIIISGVLQGAFSAALMYYFFQRQK